MYVCVKLQKKRVNTTFSEPRLATGSCKMVYKQLDMCTQSVQCCSARPFTFSKDANILRLLQQLCRNFFLFYRLFKFVHNNVDTFRQLLKSFHDDDKNNLHWHRFDFIEELFNLTLLDPASEISG